MTQIATMIATGITGLAKPGVKAPGSGALADFAAVVAGLTGDAAPAGDGDLSVLPDGTGAGAGQDFAGSGEGEAKPGETLVQDLSLNAAAQSAMADMVVQPPVPVVVAPPPPAAEAKGDADALTLDGMARGRSAAWRMASVERAAPVATPDGAAAAPQAPAAAEAVVPDAAQPAPAAVAAPILPDDAQASAPPAPVTDNRGARTAPAPVTDNRGARTAPAADLLARLAAETPAPAAARPAAPTPASLPTAAPPATAEATAAPMETAAILRQRAPVAPPRPAVVAAPVADATDDAQAPAETVTAEVAPLPVADAPPAPVRPAIAVRKPDAASITDAPAPATTETLAAAEAPAGPAIRPVMSSLHRAAPQQPGADPAQPAPIQPAAANANGGGQQQEPQDHAADQPAPSLADANAGAAPAPDAAARPFAEIAQTLPAAQPAIATDLPAVAAAGTDVGASLSNRVIDMSVGGQWIDRVAQEITQLAQGTSHSRFQLSPPNLGRIQIDIWHGEEGGRVQMLTETDEAAQRLREGQSSLQADARMAALQLGQVTIAHAPGGLDQNRNQDNPRQQQNPDANAQGFQQQGNGQQQNPQQQAPGAQLGQNWGQNGGQQNASSQNNAGQGKSPWSRDVLETGAGASAQDGGPDRGTGDRLVRYA